VRAFAKPTSSIPTVVSLPATSAPAIRVRAERVSSNEARSEVSGLAASSVPTFNPIVSPGSTLVPFFSRSKTQL
jgi:hypothetical protein